MPPIYALEIIAKNKEKHHNFTKSHTHRKQGNYHPNENSTPAPRMRCVVENKGGLPPHHLVFLCYIK